MSSKNGKILLVVSAIRQYRDYFKTEALKEIKDRLVFLVLPGLADMDFGVSRDRVFSYSYPKDKEIFHRRVFYINSWQNRRRAPFFLAHLTLSLSHRKLRIYQILSLPILSSIVKFIFLKQAEDKKLFELIQNINPSLIIIPSHAYEGMTFELIRIAKKIRVPSFMLTDNWDTLPSKTTFTIRPDYLGVWSREGVEHAVDIKDMPRERVFVLGAPRFIEYLKLRNKAEPSPYPFRYILYVGVSGQYNELGVLKKIDEIIERRALDVKVVFRPDRNQRPRNCPDVFFEYNFKHTILDIPARLFYKREATWDTKDSFNPVNAPDLSYYPKLLSNMEFMICPTTTMVLEASLFDKKVFVLVHDDDIHERNLRWDFNWGYPHIRDMEHLKNVRMVHNFNDLEKIFTPGDVLKQPVEPIDIDYFVSKENTINYPANLRRTIDAILASWHYKSE